jgi:hypothetical protein
MEQGYAAAGIEPPLEELLNDQIAQLIRRRDGIALADVWRAVEMARSRLAERTCTNVADERRGLDAIVEPTSAFTDSQIGPSSG